VLIPLAYIYCSGCQIAQSIVLESKPDHAMSDENTKICLYVRSTYGPLLAVGIVNWRICLQPNYTG